MRELIHKAKCMECYRVDDGILTVIFREDDEPRYQQMYKAIHNAADKMRLLEDSGFTPKLLAEKDTEILQEDFGNKNDEGVEGWSVEDWIDFRRALIRCLIFLRQKHIRNGDLNGNSNTWIRNKKPYLIDWWDSHFTWEKPPQAGGSGKTDAYWVFTSLIRWSLDLNLSDANRCSRRWGAIHGSFIGTFNCSLPMEGKTLLDVGCFQGDFSAWAAAENMIVTGIDTGDFSSEENTIITAKRLWKDIPNLKFEKADVMNWPNFKYDVILFMDTYSHLVKYLGKEAPTKLLNRMVNEAGCVFFETQMAGDRTGVEWLKSPEDVFALVPGAEFKHIATLPEHGIDRTLWKITRG